METVIGQASFRSSRPGRSDHGKEEAATKETTGMTTRPSRSAARALAERGQMLEWSRSMFSIAETKTGPRFDWSPRRDFGFYSVSVPSNPHRGLRRHRRSRGTTSSACRSGRVAWVRYLRVVLLSRAGSNKASVVFATRQESTIVTARDTRASFADTCAASKRRATPRTATRERRR